jgi:hypothetical protein
MFKTESVLGLVGSILECVAVFFTLIFSVIIAFIGAAAVNYADQINQAASEAGVDVSNAVVAVQNAGPAIAMVIIGLVLAIAAIILGFMGYAKLKKDNKQGGILLIVAGGLCLIALCASANFFVIPSLVLFLIGGIMAVAKKPAIQA